MLVPPAYISVQVSEGSFHLYKDEARPFSTDLDLKTSQSCELSLLIFLAEKSTRGHHVPSETSTTEGPEVLRRAVA